MIVPPIGGLGGGLPIAQSGLAQGTGTQGLQGAQEAGGALETPAVEGAGTGSGSEGFGGELTEAIGALEKTQESGQSAAQTLATGATKDPEAAVVTVEDAQLAMQLASQIRSKAAEAAQTIFQTQV